MAPEHDDKTAVCCQRRLQPSLQQQPTSQPVPFASDGRTKSCANSYAIRNWLVIGEMLWNASWASWRNDAEQEWVRLNGFLSGILLNSFLLSLQSSVANGTQDIRSVAFCGYPRTGRKIIETSSSGVQESNRPVQPGLAIEPFDSMRGTGGGYLCQNKG